MIYQNGRNPNGNVQLSVAYLGPLLDTRYFFKCEEENVNTCELDGEYIFLFF